MEQWKCDADYHSIISGRNKVKHIFQQLMGVMKEERKEINRGVGIRFGEELRVVCETGNSAIGSGDTRCETGGGLDGKRSSKKSGDRSETGE